MRTVTADDLARVLDPPSLIDAIGGMFENGCSVPVRHHHTIPVPGESDATLLLMPAWREGDYIGVKMATVFPDNGTRNMPSVLASYVLMDGKTGAPLALIDGPELTARRTAAASALAARYLARKNASRLLMVGTGKLAPHLIRAHAAARPIREVAIWGRNPDKAAALATRLDGPDMAVRAVDDLDAAVADADIISCATLSRSPLVKGELLHPGQHVDLVGGFRPDMREADDDAMTRAALFVDTRGGAIKEAGDLVDPLKRGIIKESDIRADLFELCRGAATGRTDDAQITLFKSVGTALEDLAAAVLAYEKTEEP
ncbi:MAG: ornithine cyclodeaminase family protein [Rhodospirillales bacterium]|nr:ornithine cyclodeaminase family protein [Rhodospirillales bacterium]